jgi:predicted nucleotidyltransferase
LINSTQQKRPSLHLDYFLDDKNRICQVLTWHHPNDRKLCIVKYDIGKSYWTSRETGIRYKRILKSYSLEGHLDNLKLLAKIEPDYFYKSKMYGVNFLAVPNDRIKKYYYPEERLQEIFEQEEELEEMERKVKKLAELLNDCLQIPFENMGITGSVLWKGQTEKSDIDFMIYGNSHSINFNKKFPLIYDKFPEITPMNQNKTKRYAISMAKKSGLPVKLTYKYIAIKSWLSLYDKTNLSMLFSPTIDELPFQYNEQFFIPISHVDVKCTITDASLGSAYPSIYKINECEILNKKIKQEINLQRILSFEGALTGYFDKGDEIIVRGLLEKVTTSKGESFNQVLLGTKECVGNEFILFLDDYRMLEEKGQLLPLK